MCQKLIFCIFNAYLINFLKVIFGICRLLHVSHDLTDNHQTQIGT
jgi:hypothetical protein